MYQALYRKWRPRTFDDVVGQAHITETLKQQVLSGHLSHAYLFIGSRGTGKTTCAKILAKAVNCEHPVNGNPCNECSICRGIDEGTILDVVEMDAASNNGVDNVRQLRDEAVFSPATAKKRVYIIDEVHMLSTSAFNALLKILEEPPEHLMFILATTELNKVPATILSRCQRHSFKRLDTSSIVGRLRYVAGQEGIDLAPEAAALLAGLSDGGMRDALSMLDQCSGRGRIDEDAVYAALGLAGSREIAALLRHIAAHDTAAALTLFGRLWQDGKDPATLLGELSGLERDILLRAVAPKGGRELLSGAYGDDVLAAFQKTFPVEALINHIGILQSALADLRAGQAKTTCEIALITLCEPELSDSLPALRERVAALEQALRSGAALSAPQQPDPGPEPAEELPPLPEPPDEPPFDPTPSTAERYEPQRVPVQTPEVPPAAAQGDDLGAQILARAAKALPVGRSIFLTGPDVSAALADGVLTVQTGSDFNRSNLERPDVMQALGTAAGELSGAAVEVRITVSGAPAPAAAEHGDKLSALEKFKIVKFQ